MAGTDAVSVFDHRVAAPLAAPAAGAVEKARRLHTLAFAMAAMLPVAGVLVICGWIFGNPDLISVLPGRVSMKPDTAICFILSGVALLISLARRLPSTQPPTQKTSRPLMLALPGCVAADRPAVAH